jgi:hypothetical protein
MNEAPPACRVGNSFLLELDALEEVGNISGAQGSWAIVAGKVRGVN